VTPFHRRNFVCDGGDLSPPLLKVVVTVTTSFSSQSGICSFSTRMYIFI